MSSRPSSEQFIRPVKSRPSLQNPSLDLSSVKPSEIRLPSSINAGLTSSNLTNQQISPETSSYVQPSPQVSINLEGLLSSIGSTGSQEPTRTSQSLNPTVRSESIQSPASVSRLPHSMTRFPGKPVQPSRLIPPKSSTTSRNLNPLLGKSELKEGKPLSKPAVTSLKSDLNEPQPDGKRIIPEEKSVNNPETKEVKMVKSDRKVEAVEAMKVNQIKAVSVEDKVELNSPVDQGIYSKLVQALIQASDNISSVENSLKLSWNHLAAAQLANALVLLIPDRPHLVLPSQDGLVLWYQPKLFNASPIFSLIQVTDSRAIWNQHYLTVHLPAMKAQWAPGVIKELTSIQGTIVRYHLGTDSYVVETNSIGAVLVIALIGGLINRSDLPLPQVNGLYDYLESKLKLEWTTFQNDPSKLTLHRLIHKYVQAML